MVRLLARKIGAIGALAFATFLLRPLLLLLVLRHHILLYLEVCARMRARARASDRESEWRNVQCGSIDR